MLTEVSNVQLVEQSILTPKDTESFLEDDFNQKNLERWLSTNNKSGIARNARQLHSTASRESKRHLQEIEMPSSGSGLYDKRVSQDTAQEANIQNGSELFAGGDFGSKPSTSQPGTQTIKEGFGEYSSNPLDLPSQRIKENIYEESRVSDD